MLWQGLGLGLRRLLASYTGATAILRSGTDAPVPQADIAHDPLTRAARQQQLRWAARHRRIRQAHTGLEALDHDE